MFTCFYLYLPKLAYTFSSLAGGFESYKNRKIILYAVFICREGKLLYRGTLKKHVQRLVES